MSDKLDLAWLKQHSPIFAKMMEETKARQASETEYRKLKEKAE